jgi:hypothetical protein
VRARPMTEDEWMACGDPWPMVESLRGKGSDRKLRLFACACIRFRFPTLVAERPKRALEASERFADGHASADDLNAACTIHGSRNLAPPYGTVYCTCLPEAFAAATHVPLLCVRLAGSRGVPGTMCWRSASNEQKMQASLLRDVFGNPFRPTTLEPAWLRWNDGTVAKMAQAVYDERRFADLPILADALEEAGCDDEDILGHCRRQGAEHVRGCCVLDLLLGKE